MFWNRKKENVSAILISPAYLAQISQLHATDPNWGTSGGEYAEHVIAAAVAMGAKSILDYGCGKGVLLTHLADDVDEKLGNVALQGYDPAVDGFTQPPMPADLVVCTDVLEHIEPDLLHNVLSNLQDVCKIGALFVINSGPAVHKLPDGRNAHLIQHQLEWWAERLLEFFVIDDVIPISEQSFMVVCHPWSERMVKSIEELANYNPGDPKPDTYALRHVGHLMPDVQTGPKTVKRHGLLASFGGNLKYKDQ